jgi:DNA-binding NarL/FixJ family response regulator
MVVDADPLAAAAIARALRAEPDLDVVAVARSGEEGLELADARPPDVVVLDVGIEEEQEGLHVLRGLFEREPPPAIMVLSTVDDDELALRCLRAGACGFLPKSVSIDVLPRIVRAISRGEAVLTRALTAKLVRRLREAPDTDAGLRPVRSRLSSREWEVLDLLRQGASTVEIAEQLGMARETVRSHVKRILRKLDAHSREEAAARARELVTGTPA